MILQILTNWQLHIREKIALLATFWCFSYKLLLIGKRWKRSSLMSIDFICQKISRAGFEPATYRWLIFTLQSAALPTELSWAILLAVNNLFNLTNYWWDVKDDLSQTVCNRTQKYKAILQFEIKYVLVNYNISLFSLTNLQFEFLNYRESRLMFLSGIQPN